MDSKSIDHFPTNDQHQTLAFNSTELTPIKLSSNNSGDGQSP